MMARRRRARPRASWPQRRGLTLVELVVVMALVAVLAAMAVPTLRGHVLRANRTEARALLLALATAQEKFHVDCGRYATRLEPHRPSDCETSSLGLPATSERGFYALVLTTAEADGWRAEAVATGAPQSSDRACQRLGLDSTGARTARDAADNDSAALCWSR